MKLLVESADKVAVKVGASTATRAGVRRMVATSIYQAASAGLAVLLDNYASLDLSAWVVVGIGAALQAGDKWLRSRG